jgi:PAS domain S-box-containing protein
VREWILKNHFCIFNFVAIASIPFVAGGCAQINRFTDTAGFMPHGYCLRWDPALISGMVLSNLGIALAYFTIPIAIWYLARHKKDLPYRWIFRLFAMFIIACGFSHVMKVWTLYEPFYWTEVLIDVLTAALSLLTAIMLCPLIPKALTLKSAKEFDTVAMKAQQMLQALQESEENIRLLVSNVTDYAIFMLDENGIVKTWNEGAQRIYGYTAEEIEGKHFSCFYSKEQEAKEALDIALKSGRSQFEGTRIRKDGGQFLANIIITPLYDDSRKLKGFAKITRDLTERKKAEDRFKKLLESAPDAMVIVDQQSNIVLVNSQIEKIFFYPKEEIIGQPVELLIPQWSRAICRGDRKKAFPESHLPSTDERIELTAIRKDGIDFPAEISLSPMETDHGTLLSSAIRDVSDRKQIEQSKAQLAAIVESSHDAIYSLDLRGVIKSWNQAAEKMFGYSKEEAIGRPNTIIVPTDGLKKEKMIIKMVMAGAKVEHFETVRLTKHGKSIPISLTISGIKDQFGEIIGISKIGRDVAEQKRINDVIQSQAELLDLTHDAVMVRDLDGTIRYWNHGAQKMYGFTKQEAIGRISHDLLKTDFPKPFADGEQELLDKGCWDGELIHYTKHGTSVIVSSRQTVKTDANGAPAAILEINNDITKKKKAELERVKAVVEAQKRRLI